jgi:hypothetical protein
MRTKVMKWVSIAALLLAVMFWDSAASYQLALNVVVGIAAAVVAVQALQAKKRLWAAGFLLMALVFNPAVPVFRLAGGLSLLLVVLSIVVFAISLTALKPPPLLSIASITDRNPGSQAL